MKLVNLTPYWPVILGLLVGGGVGALLGYFGQCTSGTCPLTSTWWRGALYGGFMGIFVRAFFLRHPPVARRSSFGRPEEAKYPNGRPRQPNNDRASRKSRGNFPLPQPQMIAASRIEIQPTLAARTG